MYWLYTNTNKHAAYIVEQVHSYEEAEDDEPNFSTSPCIMALVEMSKGKKLINRKSELTKKRKMRYGNCDKCMKVDCDYCTGCQRMTKFGGTGRPTELSTSSLPIISQSLSSKLPEKSSFSTLNVTLCLVSTLSFTWTWLRSRYSWQLFKNSK